MAEFFRHSNQVSKGISIHLRHHLAAMGLNRDLTDPQLSLGSEQCKTEAETTTRMFNLDWIDQGPDENILKFAEAIRGANGSFPEVQFNCKVQTACVTFFSDYTKPPVLRLPGTLVAREDALHEILHLWRWYVLKIPRFQVRELEEETEFELSPHIENMLEHTEILPIIESLGYSQHQSRLRQRLFDEMDALHTAGSLTEPFSVVSNVVQFRPMRDSIQKEISEWLEVKKVASIFSTVREKLAEFNARTPESKQLFAREFVRLGGELTNRLGAFVLRGVADSSETLFV